MVILNRIINILILLAAIAAVVFSYFLFSKREQLTNGWAQMAAAVNTAAKTLDDGGISGTTAARDLPEDKLKHTNYEQLGQVLPKLKDNAAKIVAQRNSLADSIQRAAGILSISDVDAKALKNVGSYKDKERVFTSKVQDFRDVRNHVFNEFAQVARTAGGRVSSAELGNSGTYRSAAANASAAIKDTVDRKNLYANYLNQFARALGVTPPNVNSAAYRGELDKTLRAIQAKNNEFAQTRNQLNSEKNKTRQLSNQIANQQKTIAANMNSIQQHKNRIDELTNILNKDGSITLPGKLLTGKEPECFRYVKGEIESVDKEYGFVTINLGKNYTFTQLYGIKENKVPFPMVPGRVLTVARNLNTSNPMFVGKIIVTKVSDDSAICNLVSAAADAYKVGDTVFFSDDDIAAAAK